MKPQFRSSRVWWAKPLSMLQIESMSCYLRRVAGSETNYETFLLAFKENILRKNVHSVIRCSPTWKVPWLQNNLFYCSKGWNKQVAGWSSLWSTSFLYYSNFLSIQISIDDGLANAFEVASNIKLKECAIMQPNGKAPCCPSLLYCMCMSVSKNIEKMSEKLQRSKKLYFSVSINDHCCKEL